MVDFMSKLKQIHRDRVIGLPFQAYLSSPSLSASSLKLFIDSPRKYQESINGVKFKQTKAMTIGSAVHALIEGDEAFNAAYVVSPIKYDRRTLEGKRVYAELQQDNPGMVILNRNDYDDVVAMTESMLGIPEIRVWVDSIDADREVSWFWNSVNPNMRCRCRTDLEIPSEGVVLDYKTCGDSSPEGFMHSIGRFRYDLSAVHYLEGTGYSRYGWIAVQSRKPFTAYLHWMKPDHRIEQIKVLRKEAMERLLRFNQSNSPDVVDWSKDQGELTSIPKEYWPAAEHKPWPYEGNVGQLTI